MDKQSNSYTFMFALIVCIVCSLALSAVSEGLRSKKELNVALDIKKNILKAVQLRDPITKETTADQMVKIYNDKIVEQVLDRDGNVVEGKSPADVKEGDGLLPIYVYKENGTTLAYAFPIIGKGLWSTLKGYFSLEPDGKTVRGITYYEHGETPGLGAEIEKDWFQSNFEGKKIWSDKTNSLKPVTVMKGKVADKYTGEEAMYHVDGISGATMTAKGVTAMIDRWVHAYEPFFKKVRN